MIDSLLTIIAPHLCSGCGKTGTLLCGNCKYNITSEPFSSCLVCHKPVSANGLCNTCKVPYSRAWCVGQRKDVLQRLIGLYKFERARAGYKVLGDLLLETLPVLPTNTVIVPIPTTPTHIRQRGYDHMVLVARYVAKKRRLGYAAALERRSNDIQHKVSARAREQQAKTAFAAHGTITPGVPYLIIDDIMTTGATVKYASKVLRDAGVTEVWVAVVARQLLDDTATRAGHNSGHLV